MITSGPLCLALQQKWAHAFLLPYVHALSSDPDPRAGLPAVLFTSGIKTFSTPHPAPAAILLILQDLFRHHLLHIFQTVPRGYPFSFIWPLTPALDFPVSYMLDLNGGLDHIPLVLKWNFFWTSPPAPKRIVSFFISLSSCPSPCSPVEILVI